MNFRKRTIHIMVADYVFAIRTCFSSYGKQSCYEVALTDVLIYFLSAEEDSLICDITREKILTKMNAQDHFLFRIFVVSAK